MPDVLDPSALTVVNVILGGGCAAMVAAVAIAAFRDWRERRRWKAMVPDAWPPAGADLADERADRVSPRGRGRVGNRS